jgi:hypothetical protein
MTRSRFRPRHVDTELPPACESVIGYHSEWLSPLVVQYDWSGKWYVCLPDKGEKTMGWYLIGGRRSAIKSAPLHWSYIPSFK